MRQESIVSSVISGTPYPGYDRKLEYLQEQMKAGGPCDSVVRRDMHGRHAYRPNCTPVAGVDFVKAHIHSFPRYVSHYTRDDNPRQEFLPPGLTISKLYSRCCLHCEDKEMQPVKQGRYRQIFCENFRFSFMYPCRDTCSRCDRFHVQVAGEQDPEAHACMQEQWMAHKAAAEAAYAVSSADWKQGHAEPHNVLAMYFDLQKALPAPKILTEDVYYCQQLWVYNLGIHPSLNNPWMCLSAEHEAGKVLM